MDSIINEIANVGLTLLLVLIFLVLTKVIKTWIEENYDD
tara:strand:- start:305 stop:421 length:117 start_codon:yes stop_codon:yes gene_type:complete